MVAGPGAPDFKLTHYLVLIRSPRRATVNWR